MKLSICTSFIGGLASLLVSAQNHSFPIEPTNTTKTTLIKSTTHTETAEAIKPPLHPLPSNIPADLHTNTTFTGDEAGSANANANADAVLFSQPRAGFIKTCENAWKVWDADNVIWARCTARGRNADRFWSRVGLDHMLGNVGGRLVYQKEGYFSSSCVSCGRREHTVSYLECECLNTRGEYRTTSIDLDKYLGNIDGVLCSEYRCGVREGPPP